MKTTTKELQWRAQSTSRMSGDFWQVDYNKEESKQLWQRENAAMLSH